MWDASNYKIFISYTTRNNDVDKSLLMSIESEIKIYGDVYIDLLHNDNIIDPQSTVMEMLIKSDILIVLDTYRIHESRWVAFELEKANENNIPILFLSPYDILNKKCNLQDKIYETIQSGKRI